MPSPTDASLWSLDPALVHLNHGSYGACPRPVLAAQDRWRTDLERDPTGFFVDRYWPALDQARRRLAAFVGADPADLVFVSNSTTGVNAVLRSLEPTLRAGDEILVTDHTYNACRNVVDAVATRSGARVVTAHVPFPIASRGDATAAITSAATSRTRLALIDHVTSPTALVLPIADIVAALEPDVPVLVDGAHAPGMVAVDLSAFGASYAVGNCHKWMCAPKGSAYLWARSDQRDSVEPTTISHGWNGRSRASGNRFHDLFDWPGTCDPSAWLAVPDAIDTMATLAPHGWPALMDANRALALLGRDLVTAALEADAPCPAEMVGSMAAVHVSGTGSADALRRWLRDEHAIVVPVSAWPGPDDRLARWSAQRYNSPTDYQRLAEALSPGRARGRTI